MDVGVTDAIELDGSTLVDPSGVVTFTVEPALKFAPVSVMAVAMGPVCTAPGVTTSIRGTLLGGRAETLT